MTFQRDIGALIAFIDSRQLVPHSWGRRANDCVSFGLGAVEAQTGIDLVPDLTWSNRAEALRIIKRLGGMEAAIDGLLERIPLAQAMRGDIAGVPDELLAISPAIVEGELLVAPGGRGNKRLKRRVMVCAWSAVRPKSGHDE